jgi:hypothetical protein
MAVTGGNYAARRGTTRVRDKAVSVDGAPDGVVPESRERPHDPQDERIGTGVHPTCASITFSDTGVQYHCEDGMIVRRMVGTGE